MTPYQIPYPKQPNRKISPIRNLVYIQIYYCEESKRGTTRVWCAHNSSILVGEYIIIRSKQLLSVKTAASRVMVDSIIRTHWWMAWEIQ